MPKNKGKGGKNRRRGKNENEQTKRELDLKEEGQEYAQVMKILGNGRIKAYCFDGKERLCNIRGKLRKKCWINTNDIVLLGLRDYQDEKADVIQKYSADEARRLKAQGHIPDSVTIDTTEKQDDDMIAFRNEGDDDDDLDDENAVPMQKSAAKNTVNFNGIEWPETTDDEDDDEDEEDEEESGEEEYTGYQQEPCYQKSSKKEFNIDDI